MDAFVYTIQLVVLVLCPVVPFVRYTGVIETTFKLTLASTMWAVVPIFVQASEGVVQGRREVTYAKGRYIDSTGVAERFCKLTQGVII